jgi:TRAP-type C4-dicarboxylate transport system permease large subunit
MLAGSLARWVCAQISRIWWPELTSSGWELRTAAIVVTLLGVFDVVVPPFVVWIGAGRLEACPVADLDEQVTDLNGA